jgi:dihydrolipoamide dehydrogenase
MPVRFVIIGGGPAGHQAATTAARHGADVTLIERDVIGGAANLWDCVPSKAMIATGGAMSFSRRYQGMGLAEASPELDLEATRARVKSIEHTLEQATTSLLQSQGVRLVHGTGRLDGPNTVIASTDAGEQRFDADAILVSTGSRPRLPEWAHVDAERVLTTRDAYPPSVLPEHLVVIGSGVTGVEFVHMFGSIGSQVSLVVSRQQVLPGKDAEVAAALEENFIERGVQLYKGARAQGIEVTSDGVIVACNDGRRIEGTHALLAIGSVPNSEGLGLAEAGVEVNEWGYVVTDDHHLRSSVPHIYVAGDLSGKLPLASVATMQGKKIAEHVMGLHVREHRHLDYDKAASAIFTEPEIADVGIAEADAFADGRKIRVTKVPFSLTAKALINNDPRGFVKILSDPATGVVLGGSIVGRHAAELISVLAVAVTNGLTVADIAESLLVHPTLAEALTEAAE